MDTEGARPGAGAVAGAGAGAGAFLLVAILSKCEDAWPGTRTFSFKRKQMGIKIKIRKELKLNEHQVEGALVMPNMRIPYSTRKGKINMDTLLFTTVVFCCKSVDDQMITFTMLSTWIFLKFMNYNVN